MSLVLGLPDCPVNGKWPEIGKGDFAGNSLRTSRYICIMPFKCWRWYAFVLFCFASFCFVCLLACFWMYTNQTPIITLQWTYYVLYKHWSHGRSLKLSYTILTGVSIVISCYVLIYKNELLWISPVAYMVKTNEQRKRVHWCDETTMG